LAQLFKQYPGLKILVGDAAFAGRAANGLSLCLSQSTAQLHQSLLPSEQIGLGGYNSVRGYDERQETLDSGVLASYELRGPLWPLGWSKQSARWQLLGFVDYGWGTDHTAVIGLPKQDWMLGIGPGLRYTFTPYMTTRLDWGFKMHHRPLYTGGNSELHFSVIGSY
jgi:hemolysin activation/secretion protein